MNGLDIALLFFLEIIEANLQKGHTANGLIGSLYGLWKRAWPRFFLLHLSLIYVVFYAVGYGVINGWMVLLIVIKVFDLGLKLWLFSQIDRRGAFSLEHYYGVPDMVITPSVRYMGALFYTGLFAAALLQG